ncbi:MAG: PLP-dependent aminotransferase family protein [Vicinamibacterales bacterium]
MIDYDAHLSTAARRYHESAIRRAGAVAGRIADLISFAPGYPSAETFPWDALERITTELLQRRSESTFQYGATRGYRPLIEAVIADLTTRGFAPAFEEMVITTGSQQGLDLAGRVLFDPGDVVLVELPAYSGAIAAFVNLQASLAGVTIDEDGMVPEALDAVVTRLRGEGRRPRALYLTPNFQNPAGLLMSAARRRALLEAAARHDLLVIEDDPYGSLYFEGSATAADTRPMKADDPDGRVIYLGTMSKTLVPGLRAGWLVAPAPIATKVEIAKQAADLCSSVFDQRIVHGAMSEGVVASLAPRLRAHYRARRDAMEQALRTALGDRVSWQQPRGGFFLWLRLPEGIDDRTLFDCGLEEKVSFVIGSAFHVDGAGHDHARLSYSSPSEERIAEGVRRLAVAVEKAERSAPAR